MFRKLQVEYKAFELDEIGMPHPFYAGALGFAEPDMLKLNPTVWRDLKNNYQLHQESATHTLGPAQWKAKMSWIP